MKVEEVRTAMQTRPFRQFVLHLSGDESVRVPHPEHLLFLRDNRTVIVAGDEGGHSVIDLDLVTRLEVGSPTHTVGEPGTA